MPRVHLVQLDIAWEDRPANRARAEALIDRADPRPGDLVILPEMFDTGFSFATERTADLDGTTQSFLAGMAGRRGITVLGGFTHTDPNGSGVARGLNRAAAFGPEGGRLANYDKVHPFSIGREHERIAAGAEIVTFRWEGSAAMPGSSDAVALRVAPIICFDLRFPELFRRALDFGAEAFAVIANWPCSRAHHWRALLVARAIENQAFIFAVNRCGHDPLLEYHGGSIVIGPKGEVLAEANDQEMTLSAEVDFRAVAEWRRVFPAWRDRRHWLSP